MNLVDQVALPRVSIPKTGTSTTMHLRRKARGRDQSRKSPRYKMRIMKSYDVCVAITRRKRICSET
jgi:hypothetical protein